MSRAGGGARSCPEHRRRIRRPCGPGRCRPRWRCEGDRGSRCRRPRRPRRTAVVRLSGGRSASPATCRRCTSELDDVDGARAGPARRDGQPRGRASHDHGRRRRSRPTTAWLEALDDYGEALRLQEPMAALFQERGRRGAPAETGRALKARGIRPGWERTARGHQWRSGAVRGRGVGKWPLRSDVTLIWTMPKRRSTKHRRQQRRRPRGRQCWMSRRVF